MKNNIKFIPAVAGLAMAGLAIIAAGCASAPSKFYTLNATAKADGAVGAHYTVAVEPVTVPAEVDRPQFTLYVSPNRVTVDEFNRWAGPLGENIGHVVAANLSALLGNPQITAASLANFAADYEVSLNLQRFVSVPGKSVEIEAVWVVKPVHGDPVSGHTLASETVADASCDALAAAHSQALARLSGDIAAALRTTAGAK